MDGGRSVSEEGFEFILMEERRNEHHDDPSLPDFDSLPTANNHNTNNIRYGDWTPEEQRFANRLIVDFKSGLLPLDDGTSLIMLLSLCLQRDMTQISEKLTDFHETSLKVLSYKSLVIDSYYILWPEFVLQ